MVETIPFTEEAVKDHLDLGITLWRKRQERAESENDFASTQIAISYVDAFQSIRLSLFGELLPLPEVGESMQEVAEEWMGGDKDATIPRHSGGTVGDPNR